MPAVAMPWLVGYYGLFQAGHLILNVVYLSGLRPIQGFPPPPAEGWHPQATAFLTAGGLIDTAIALLALYFVAACLCGRRRALWAGLVSLTTYMYNTFTFNYIVIATGAWAQHPVEYLALNVASIPLALLFALVVRDVREAVGAGGKEHPFDMDIAVAGAAEQAPCRWVQTGAKMMTVPGLPTRSAAPTRVPGPPLSTGTTDRATLRRRRRRFGENSESGA